MKAILFFRFQLIIVLFIIPALVNAQGKEANNWYFGQHAGITFQQGSPPEALLDGQTDSGSGTGTASISDKDGNLLFYSDGVTIWNRNHQVMTNGTSMGAWSTQGAMIIQDPGNESRYYFFNYVTSGNPGAPFNFQYSVIDMTNGLGEVLPDQKGILLCTNTTWHLTAVLHDNMTNVWVLTHGLGSNRFIAFEITPDSIKTTPVNSYAGTTYVLNEGYMKISSDGKWIGVGNHLQYLTEIYHFDNETGIVSNQNVVTIPTSAYGIEFSPDNTKMYAQGGFYLFYQYDLSAGDPAQIAASGYQLAQDLFNLGALQLGPDGKIYVGTGGYYLGVIHDPDKKGILCNFEFEAVYLEGRSYMEGLPTFLQSYMRNPEFTSNQKCSGLPTQFNIVNTNGIDSVLWKFDDPGNAPNDTSTLFSPGYTFSTAGTFYVELTAYSGNLHRTVTDTVIINETPDPQLCNDTSFCANETINLELDAGPGESYYWNGLIPGGQIYNATAPGLYTVRVLNHGCAGRDTININQYTAPIVDTTNSSVFVASCTAPDGRITGITVTGGSNVTYEWRNSTGSIVSNTLDLLDMPAGIYALYVKYGDNCTVEPYVFEIENAVRPQIKTINVTNDRCGEGKGRIEIIAVSSSGEALQFSLNGSPFSTYNIFLNLTSGLYTVTVKDANGCTDSQTVNVLNQPGPMVTDSISTPENGYSGDGTITIMAEGDSLFYMLDNGIPQDSGVFTGLSQGDYNVTITDKWGCIRLVKMTVGQINGTLLSAYAGDDYKCKKQQAFSTISADNFINIKEYTATLEYDNLRLQCTGFNPAPNFLNIKVTNSSGRVEVEWTSNTPKTLPGTVQLVDLIFEATEWGSADIKWDTAFCEFKDHYGNLIQSSLYPGLITINNPPQLINQSEKTTFCEGERAELIVTKTGGTGPFTYNWQIPGNITANDTTVVLDSITLNQSGSYNLTITDANNCSDILSIPVNVVALPTANFPTGNDTIYFEQQATLIAQQGYASYLWNNGDTTYFTIVDEEGEYSVLIQTTEGCQNLESVVMTDAHIDIKVPTAFTPNGDGLNDTFKPLVDLDRIRQYHIGIYNKWGQLIFETSDPLKGWEGKDLTSGVYTWAIDYMNRVGKASQIKGSVALIK